MKVAFDLNLHVLNRRSSQVVFWEMARANLQEKQFVPNIFCCLVVRNAIARDKINWKHIIKKGLLFLDFVN